LSVDADCSVFAHTTVRFAKPFDVDVARQRAHLRARHLLGQLCYP
jgi:hypothetical protein